jgi:RHS repeat-associated protein
MQMNVVIKSYKACPIMECCIIRDFDELRPPIVITVPDWTTEYYYTHLDNMGSIQLISDNNANLVNEWQYSAWGARTRIYGDSDLTNRGYTLHEHILSPFGGAGGGFGLINMNGRIYDPVLAKFLSPDPYVQMPNFTQNFNRYSYCLNNPFSYTDPSGEFIITALIVGAIIGATVGAFYGYKIGKAEGATGWGMVGYIFGGAGIGLVGGAAAGAAGAAVGGALAAAGIGGFAGGALAGGTAGVIGGFVNGAGMSWLGGASGLEGLKAGAIGAGVGLLTGAVLGGTIQGIDAASRGGSFWTGKMPTAPTAPTPTPTTDNANIGTQAQPTTELKPYNANYQDPSEVQIPNKISYYTDKDPHSWTTIGRIEDPKPVYFTSNDELSKIGALNDLALNKVPNFRLDISGEVLDPNKVLIIRNVTGNVFRQGGGGWEIIYMGPLDISKISVTITPLP